MSRLGGRSGLTGRRLDNGDRLLQLARITTCFHRLGVSRRSPSASQNWTKMLRP